MALNSRRKLAPTVQNLLDNMKVTALAKTAQDGDIKNRGVKTGRGRSDDDERTEKRLKVQEGMTVEAHKKNQDTSYEIKKDMTDDQINLINVSSVTSVADGEKDLAQIPPIVTERARNLAVMGCSRRSGSTPAHRAKSGKTKSAREKRKIMKVKSHY